ncbi:hypothetical protein ANAPC5_01270 [Anaplasma phagocytophilum]|nr:hypothetical protein ANAPC5_01270 [Anaplasma phagocytophilum]
MTRGVILVAAKVRSNSPLAERAKIAFMDGSFANASEGHGSSVTKRHSPTETKE